MKWTGKGGLSFFYQPDTKAMATNTIILHLNWLDLFERFVGNLMTMSLQSGYKISINTSR